MLISAWSMLTFLLIYLFTCVSQKVKKFLHNLLMRKATPTGRFVMLDYLDNTPGPGRMHPSTSCKSRLHLSYPVTSQLGQARST